MFKIGQEVKIKENGRAGRAHLPYGKVGKIISFIKVGSAEPHGCKVNIGLSSVGLWFDEVEIVGQTNPNNGIIIKKEV